ncbi:hypothetical protein B0H66DRAFT_546515 [Apodospora peruviana]|uniref:Uncharacterized protein n=1 Tax=Apodospora peruviana TaxID=516989 RepID=A0AAE0MG82_9PEZI|nr:hypothetical protein B0H66DRAFT_546515 [Apodospora peruviana]
MGSSSRWKKATMFSFVALLSLTASTLLALWVAIQAFLARNGETHRLPTREVSPRMSDSRWPNSLISWCVKGKPKAACIRIHVLMASS